MELDFEKENGLIPAIVQDHLSGEVLMLGFMNREALVKTQETGFVTFYSRSIHKQPHPKFHLSPLRSTSVDLSAEIHKYAFIAVSDCAFPFADPIRVEGFACAHPSGRAP